MPTRRLVVALTVLLFGVFGVGIVTALSRSGDDGGKPSAQPSPSVSVPPLQTVPPPSTDPTDEPSPEPTPTPTVAPTGDTDGDGEPDGDTDGDGDVDGNDSGGNGGSGGGPRMPNTGLPTALGLAATGALAAAYGLRRVTR